jgi:hypothetical protein
MVDVKRIKRDKMIDYVDSIINEKRTEFSQKQVDERLLLFCVNCPDPGAAYDIIVETAEDISAEEMVDRALSCPARPIESYTENEIPLGHPLRIWKPVL